MKKILSVIFILVLLILPASCGKPAHETTDIAMEEFVKSGIDNPEIALCALGGFADKAIGVYFAQYGEDEYMCLAVEFDVNGENSYSYSQTYIPEETYERIYTLSWHEKTVLFVANEDCETVVVDCGEDGNRVDYIRNSSYPYFTMEDGEKAFLCYNKDMKEISR